MKTASVLIATTLVATALLAFVPSASAVGICSEFTDSKCSGWILCVGYQWSSTGGFRCTGTGIRDPCSYHCPPPYEALP